MSYQNSPRQFGAIARLFHWLTSGLVITLLIVGLIMTGLNNSPIKFMIYNWHKLFGLFILTLTVLRLSWRLIDKPRPPLPTMPTWQRWAAHISHASLFALLIMMPLSGWMMATASQHIPHLFNFMHFPMPGISANKQLAKWAHNIHEILGYTFIVSISIHVLAVIKHHVIDKNDTLHRMLPLIKKPK